MISTNTAATTTHSAPKEQTAATAFTSPVLTESISRSPTPCRPNTFSMKTAPANRPAAEYPK